MPLPSHWNRWRYTWVPEQCPSHRAQSWDNSIPLREQRMSRTVNSQTPVYIVSVFDSLVLTNATFNGVTGGTVITTVCSRCSSLNLVIEVGSAADTRERSRPKRAHRSRKGNYPWVLSAARWGYP